MPLNQGTRLGPYEILSPLGAGGMGEVYKARDTRLARDVALKVLPERLAADPHWRQRFEREARTISALNHPHICTLFDVGPDYLVMEHIDGTPLHGPLPVRESLRLAVQIADALDAAHRKGITHRDLKPGNVLVTKMGVKLLDFGLAKSWRGIKAMGDEKTQSISEDLTREGAIVGTPQYMAPEQLEGREADPRSDIFAFGCVLYEMISGRRAFEGKSAASVMAAILQTDPPPVSTLQPEAPATLDRIVKRCLAKDPDDRWQTARDLKAELEWVAEPESKSAKPPPARARERMLLGAVGVLLLAIAILAGLWLRAPTEGPELPLRRFAFAPDHGVSQPVISPDGRHIAYATRTEEAIWIQDLEQDEPRKVAASYRTMFPSWAPGGDSIVFTWIQLHLHKVSVHGGSPITLCEAPSVVKGQIAWSPDGKSIVFGAGFPSRLYEVPAQGGVPKLLFEVKPEESGREFQNPHFLPSDGNGHRLVFAMGLPGNTQIVAQELETGRREILAPGDRPFFSPTSHIIYQSVGGLWAIPISVKNLEPTGEAFPIRQNASDASVARDGTLAYLSREGGLQQLIWRDRRSVKVGSLGQAQQRARIPRLSPDGKRVAARGEEKTGESDIWIHEVARSSKTRLTSDPAGNDRPIWTPQGNMLTFSSPRSGNWDIFLQQADGSSEPEVLVATPHNDFGYDWSDDGRYLIYGKCREGCDLWYLRRKEGQKGFDPVPFIQSPFDESTADLSPDGRFLAYDSNESGRYEVYVRRFPDGTGKRLVSTKGGRQARWRKDGKELFYVEDATLIAVSVTTAPDLFLGAATRLFEDKNGFAGRGLQYDVSADGQRFVLPETLEEPKATIRVVQNWFAEFRDRQQPRRPVN